MPTTAAPPILPQPPTRAPLTRHARERMYMRGLSEEALELTLAFGRIVWTRGVQVFAIGRREARRFSQEGVELSRYEGVQVVCTPAGPHRHGLPQP